MPGAWELTAKAIHTGMCSGVSWADVWLFLNAIQAAKLVYMDNQGMTIKPV